MNGIPELSVHLEDNLKSLQSEFKDCSDITLNRLKTACGRDACLIFVHELTDINLVQRDVLPVLIGLKEEEIEDLKEVCPFHVMRSRRVYVLEEVVDAVVNIDALLLIDGLDFAFSFYLQKIETRPPEEPAVERIIKGQHDGFVESAVKNISFIRKKVRSSKLKVVMTTIGKRSNTTVALLYLEDLANPGIVKRVRDRISQIEIDNINGAGYIEQLTNDSPYSPFPQYQATERPDKAIANMMEGRVVIIVDNTPIALIVPVDYFQFFQTPEDYNVNAYFGTFLRLLRFGGTILAVLLPALYIAILTYHYQSIPLNLLVPLAESRSRVPFPPIIEALIMELSFELLREASVRLPQSLGPTIGIVGGLVIGQTAIQAGLVSNVMVIIVGITAIATFVVPQYDMSLLLRLSRFACMINAAVFGIVGVMIFVLMALAHLVTLESYGQPYFQPVAPLKLSGLKDVFIRAPLKWQTTRPEIGLPKDRTRGRGNSGKK